MRRTGIHFAFLCTILPCWLSAQPETSSARDLALAIRTITLDPDQCYAVRDLTLFRDDIKLYFNDGYLIFSKPVAGERIAAVFAGGEDPADGEVLLVPPSQGERISLAKFTSAPNLNDHFRAALLTFTDGTAQALLNQINMQGKGRKSSEVAATLTERWTAQIATLTSNVTQRIVADLLAPTRGGGGFLFGTLTGNRLGNFDVIYDPLGDDQIVAGKMQDHGGAYSYEVWTRFPARGIRNGSTKPYEPLYALSNYKIQASVGQNLSLKATTHATMKIGGEPVRTLVFALSRAERPIAARIDGQPVEIVLQESERGRVPRPDENDVFLIVAPERLAPGSSHEIEIEHEGSVIVDRGNNVYSVDARSNWYPRSQLEFAQYDLEFRYPADLTLVTPGEVVEDRTDGMFRTTRRRSVVPIRVAGFNLGSYARVSSEADGFTVDVYGNRSLDPSLAPKPQLAIVMEQGRPIYRGGPIRPETNIVSQTATPPDPLGRLKTVAADVSESLKYFATLFGPPPLKTLTVSPIPGTTGQGFPGLIYLATLSYVDEKQRPASARGERARLFFSDLMVAHEVAHQWWGNIVAARAYQDDWLLEALAHYSALLWLEKKKGPQALEAELAEFRTDLLMSSRDGGTVEAFGPLTWGYRLESAREPDTWRAITYEKGAWVLHMLRQRLGDPGFFRMLAELRRRFESNEFTGQDLRALAAEFLPHGPSSGPTASESMGVFFDNWIQSTGVPELRLRYTTETVGSGRSSSVRLTGSVEQKEVGDDFSVDVPVEIQLPGGKRQTLWVRTNDAGGRFSVSLPQQPSRVSIPASGVLATIK